MRESELHHAVVQFLNLTLDEGVEFHHSPNAAKRSWAAQRDLKKNGVMTGFPDLILLFRGLCACIELKAPKGKLSPAQHIAHAKLRAAGIPVVVARSLAEVQLALEDWGVPMRRVRLAA